MTYDSGIPIDIPGVEPGTRLGDMTVEQFTKLFVQIIQAMRRVPTDAELNRMLTTIRKFNAETQTAVSDEIYHRLPDLVHKLTTDSGT